MSGLLVEYKGDALEGNVLRVFLVHSAAIRSAFPSLLYPLPLA